jgi:hypothetical protein
MEGRQVRFTHNLVQIMRLPLINNPSILPFAALFYRIPETPFPYPAMRIWNGKNKFRI